MLAYRLKVMFADGTWEQYNEDGTENPYSDIIKKGEENVVYAALIEINGSRIFSVNLCNNTFNINGEEKQGLVSKENKLLYRRRTRVNMSSSMRPVGEPSIEFHLGYKTEDGKENYISIQPSTKEKTESINFII